MMLTAVDFFSGGGGLTVGLKAAGFSVVSAVELDKEAYSTYKANHPEVKAFCQDIRSIQGRDLVALAPNGRIDLIAACPPCQGFTSLTAKYRKRDPRNDLILEMSRLIGEIKPQAVMLENVPLLLDRGKRLWNRFLREIEDLGYLINDEQTIFQVADYGVPQRRRRLVVLAGRGFKIDFPKPTHSRTGEMLPRWRTLKDAIYGLPKPITLTEAKQHDGPRAAGWHVVRDMVKANKDRLRHSKPGACRMNLPKKLRPKCHQNVEEGFSNVYGRLKWTQPSVTITGGCTTLSKGRFGHPTQMRTISVREAALLQTFPPDYIFDTPYMDYVCDIIGNALPCVFAEAMSTAVHMTLTARASKQDAKMLPPHRRLTNGHRKRG